MASSEGGRFRLSKRAPSDNPNCSRSSDAGMPDLVVTVTLSKVDSMYNCVDEAQPITMPVSEVTILAMLFT